MTGKRGRITSILCIILSLSMVFSGCGYVQTVVDVIAEAVRQEDAGWLSYEDSDLGDMVLLEPVESAQPWEKVIRRDFYDIDQYTSAVYPYSQEYAFPINGVLDQMMVGLSDHVKKGTILAYADRSGLEEKIEAMESQIKAMEEAYLEYKESVEKQLEESEALEKQLLSVVEAYEKAEPKKYAIVSGNEAQEEADSESDEPQMSDEYLQWESEYQMYYGRYRILSHQNNVLKQALSQRTQTYELDHAYQMEQLAKLKQEEKQYILTSSMEGEVVAADYIRSKFGVRESNAIFAVGDMNRKLIKCRYISETDLRNAEDYYALINGVRYEVDYLPISKAEYSSLTAKGENIYSSFELIGAEDVSVGTYAVFVVVNKVYRKCLSIPVSAVFSSVETKYVYLRQGDEMVVTPVKLGYSDGVYAEVVSGLSENDEVALTAPSTIGSKRAVLEKGDIVNGYAADGYFYYPKTESVVVDVTYGSAYFIDYKVVKDQYVEKGTVLAEIRVVGDEISLKRLRENIDVLKARLADLVEEGAEGNAKLIEQRREQIAELEKQADKMEKDYATTAIVAPCSGLVISLEEYAIRSDLLEGDLIAEIAEMHTCYVQVYDPKHELHYGMETTVLYRDVYGKQHETTGMVVNLSSKGVSNNLDNADFAFIKLPQETIDEMVQAYLDWNSYAGIFMYARSGFQIRAETGKMENVVLVPDKAVEIINGNAYVTVEKEDGSLVRQSFVTGGSTIGYYWVIEGLEEGMKVCLE